MIRCTYTWPQSSHSVSATARKLLDLCSGYPCFPLRTVLRLRLQLRSRQRTPPLSVCLSVCPLAITFSRAFNRHSSSQGELRTKKGFSAALVCRLLPSRARLVIPFARQLVFPLLTVIVSFPLPLCERRRPKAPLVRSTRSFLSRVCYGGFGIPSVGNAALSTASPLSGSSSLFSSPLCPLLFLAFLLFSSS